MTLTENSSFNKLFLERYPSGVSIVRYVCEALGKNEVLLKDLTRVNLKKVNDTILDHVTPGAAKTYFAHIKAFIHLYEEENILPCTEVTKLLHAKKMPSQNVYLTESEINDLEEYLELIEHKNTGKVKDTTEIDILHAFLAECYCGARGCDVAEFTDDNFCDNKLIYISKKTKVLSQLPVHKNLREHLNHKPAKKYFSAVMNKVIKRICKVCGINETKTIYYRGSLITQPKYKFVGFHTARRSFATNLHLRNVPIAVIAQMMNHGNDLTMTQRYIVTDVNSIDDNAMKFFT